ncbi:MAG: BMP family ABC transporter substrate-binding protein [Oscillospiraceae bacterium]|nr:BMP family ABC transporter substrate-binding protein [Oscillospiraceae bacterium]
MKLTKIIAAISAAAVLMLTGCSSNTADNGSADTASDSASASTIQYAKEDIKIGVIHIGNPADGSGYSYTHDVGIQDMQAALGLSDDQIIRKNNVSDGDPTATETAIRECIEAGCNIIFGTSWGYMDTMEALADEFPNVVFSHGTGYKNNGKNMNNYFGRIYQARYLSGIVAGMKTESNLIGYVAAMGSENSEVTGGIDAFAIGVASVNPDAKIYVKVTNSWYSPTEETNAAKALIAEGCDVIAQHCDTPNPQLEAESANVWGVGYNSDMIKDAPGATLTSVEWHWGAYYTQAVQQVIDGTWNCENYFGGMADGLLDISDLNSALCTDEMQAKVDEARNEILNNGFNVFDGVLETNDGSTVGEEGSTLDDATIKGGINWYYKNVEVK